MTAFLDVGQAKEVKVLCQKGFGHFQVQVCVPADASDQVFVRYLHGGKEVDTAGKEKLPVTAVQISQDLITEVTSAYAKWNRIRRGQKACLSESQFDILLARFSTEENEGSRLFYRDLVLIHDPKQVGTINTYLAWLKV